MPVVSVIGIFGGTFDPIHYGHLRPATEARDRLGLAEVRFLPAAVPPHRPPPVASAGDRRAMVEIAIRGMVGFRCDDRELRRAGPSYTVSTLTELRAELGATPLCLLIGMDQFLELETWYRWQEIPELVHLAVLNRPGRNPGEMPSWARARLAPDPAIFSETPAGQLAFLPVSPQDISASRIRMALARGESAEGLLPESVLDYIRQKGLYGPANRGA